MDPEIGRFLTQDPLQEFVPLVGASIYSYVANNPANFGDPLGLEQCRMFVRYGQAERQIEWSTESQMTSRRLYPQLVPIIAANPIWRLLGFSSNNVGTAGFLLEECSWTNYFVSTTYLRQRWTVVRACTCPDSRTVLGGGVDEERLGQIRRRIGSTITQGSLGLRSTGCPRPTW